MEVSGNLDMTEEAVVKVKNVAKHIAMNQVHWQ